MADMGASRLSSQSCAVGGTNSRGAIHRRLSGASPICQYTALTAPCTPLHGSTKGDSLHSSKSESRQTRRLCLQQRTSYSGHAIRQGSARALEGLDLPDLLRRFRMRGMVEIPCQLEIEPDLRLDAEEAFEP